MILVGEARSVDDELVEAFARLVPQLSSSSPPTGPDELGQMLEAPGTHVVLAREENGPIIGTLTLVVFRIPTGVRAWIEDVVVDEAARGQGVGEALTRHALDLSAAAGARTVDLTSRPTREVANRLYQRLGFEPRDTNVWRFHVPRT
ncbi:MAG: GNAT family N-acetyltransferase [Acidimicrobiales bacterium]